MGRDRGAHVVVTGAAGFIGSHLVRALRADGHRVVGVDDHRGGDTRALASARLAELVDDPGFDLLELDVADPAFAGAAAGARAIFHFAGRPGARELDVDALRRGNVTTTARVVAAADAAGVPDLVFASTSSVYGDGGRRGPSQETDAAVPLTAYGESKRAAERVVLGARQRSTVVRLFTVYGPHQRSDMAFARFAAAARTGATAPMYQEHAVARDFTYVDDAVRGTILAWRRGTAPVYNVSGGEAIPLARACRTIEELTGGTIRTYSAPAPAQPSVTAADLSLARRHLGYRPEVDLRTGLRAQIAAMPAVQPVTAG